MIFIGSAGILPIPGNIPSFVAFSEFSETHMVCESINVLDKTVPVQSVHTGWLYEAGVSLDMLRLDQLDPGISGNKWYKLKHNLIAAQQGGKSSILSFGGAWSNHIHALAAAGHRFGMSTIGIIRGEPGKSLSATLSDAVNWGMQLHFLSRSDYRRKTEHGFLNHLLSQLGLSAQDVHVVPEGGSNFLGVQGCRDILAAGGVSAGSYDEIWLACGTGATLSGVALAAAKDMPEVQVTGVAVLKGGDFLRNAIDNHTIQSLPNWRLLTDCHHGGYARTTKALLSFIKSFENETAIPLDPVYTGKVMFAIWRSLAENRMQDLPCRGRRLLMIHTGGLQGRRGIKI
ncbi:1-aminocyclopropane-1-carboxylate deaminase/D-cysteine desulfhydrase [Endozoicomonas sp. SCSIO W0465]|uniref:1-aminocyclopropane-1-carboxylate deaminase/D-cysteine desulfhydrase n=1 Tax=Endozoicomonas sp. SCSIO W0465 TaxID=2918516 RepID=UPI002074C2F2|nr:pyridoxal-phosphate dependent enzyme [Endozoicomonas sp. SCSIO W0465]USE38828.1 pyridoxal-phosphate dependent enzyme [Endozoicomonas sp. SCSIO W0465]